MPSDEKRTYFKLEEATGITEIENEELKMNNGESGAAIYDLSGRCIDNSKLKTQNSQLPKGVYIHKGKKFMVKWARENYPEIYPYKVALKLKWTKRRYRGNFRAI